MSTDGAAARRRRVVIIGGGFGGMEAAQRLRRADVDVTVVDRNNYHQFQPLLYQVATSLLSPTDIAHSLREVFANQDNVDVKLAEIASIDLDTRTVTASDGATWSASACTQPRPAKPPPTTTTECLPFAALMASPP